MISFSLIANELFAILVSSSIGSHCLMTGLWLSSGCSVDLVAVMTVELTVVTVILVIANVLFICSVFALKDTPSICSVLIFPMISQTTDRWSMPLYYSVH